MTLNTSNLGLQFHVYASIGLLFTISLRISFEICRFTRFKDMTGALKFKNVSRDLVITRLILVMAYVCL